jgi:hypothetical protein
VARHRVKPAGILFLLTLAPGLLLPQSPPPTPPKAMAREGRVILFVLDPISFEDLLAVPEFESVARAGGAALMTGTADDLRDPDHPLPAAAHRAIADGRRSPGGGPPLTNVALAAHGVSACVFGAPEARGEERAGLSLDLRGAPARVFADGPEGGVRGCSLPDVTFDRRLVIVVDTREILRAEAEEGAPEGSPQATADLLSRAMIFLSGPRTLLVVVVPEPTAAMRRVGDEVTPLLVAAGAPDQLSVLGGPTHALASGTTRRAGLVSNVDVAPTVLDFFGVPIPAEMEGQPVGVSDEPAPFELHRRHLEQRRIRLPMQLGEVTFVALLAIVGIAALAMLGIRGGLPLKVTAGLRLLALCGVALPIPLLLGGVLPRLTYPVVVPYVVVTAAALAAVSVSVAKSLPTGPFTFLGAVGLTVLVGDALFGWPGARIPLLGGTMFDGARFYGLPNAFIALLLASALFVAIWLEPFRGLVLLVAAGLFAGFPSLGANIGASIALFSAAGLWWVLRTRERFGPKEVAFVAGVIAVGLGAVLLVNRYLAGTPTHATRFVETETSPGDILRVFTDRLSVGIRMLNEVPAGYLPVLGLPVLLWLVLARPAAIGWGLDLAGDAWRRGLMCLTVAGMVAFLVEDTGVAAAGPVFLYAMAGMAYPAFLASEAKRRVA